VLIAPKMEIHTPFDVITLIGIAKSVAQAY